LTQICDEMAASGNRIHLSLLSRIFNGKNILPSKYERTLMQVVRATDRKSLKKKYPKIIFPAKRYRTKPASLPTLASKLHPYLPSLVETSIYSRLRSYIGGSLPVPMEWEQPLCAVTGCTARRALRQKWPKIRFNCLYQDQIVETLLSLEPEINRRSLVSLLPIILSGKRKASTAWEKRLLTATELKTRKDLLVEFPHIVFTKP